MDMWSASRCHCFRESKRDFWGARASRVLVWRRAEIGFLKTNPPAVGWLLQKFAIVRTRSPARETRALPRTARPTVARCLLRAFFERSRFAAQMRENFTGEM
jgi:hypothetical protein